MQDPLCVSVCNFSIINAIIVGEITSKSQYKSHLARSKCWIKPLSRSRSSGDGLARLLGKVGRNSMGEECWKALQVFKKRPNQSQEDDHVLEFSGFVGWRGTPGTTWRWVSSPGLWSEQFALKDCWMERSDNRRVIISWKSSFEKVQFKLIRGSALDSNYRNPNAFPIVTLCVYCATSHTQCGLTFCFCLLTCFC